MHDTIIIGAGISGLFMGLKCLQTGNSNFIILEQKSRLGGKIKSLKIDDETTYDSGALRIAKTHTFLLRLIASLQLKEQLTVHNPKLSYFINGKMNQNTSNTEIAALIGSIKELRYVMKRNNSLEGLAQYLDMTEQSEIARIKFGYDKRFLHQNASNLLRHLKQYTNVKYFKMKRGLHILCNTMENIIGSKRIQLKTQLRNISYDSVKKLVSVHTVRNHRRVVYQAQKLVLCMPQENLLQVPYLRPYFPLFKSVDGIPLLRIIAKYPRNAGTDTFWYENLETQKVVTDLPIRKFCILDPEHGIVLVCYNDYQNARFFNWANKFHKFI